MLNPIRVRASEGPSSSIRLGYEGGMINPMRVRLTKGGTVKLNPAGVINEGVADIDNAPASASVTYWESLTEEEKAVQEDWLERRRQKRLKKAAEEEGQEVKAPAQGGLGLLREEPLCSTRLGLEGGMMNPMRVRLTKGGTVKLNPIRVRGIVA